MFNQLIESLNNISLHINCKLNDICQSMHTHSVIINITRHIWISCLPSRETGYTSLWDMSIRNCILLANFYWMPNEKWLPLFNTDSKLVKWIILSLHFAYWWNGGGVQGSAKKRGGGEIIIYNILQFINNTFLCNIRNRIKAGEGIGKVCNSCCHVGGSKGEFSYRPPAQFNFSPLLS